MDRDISLGRIAGIRIGFSWSVLLIAGLYTYLLATNRFPIDAPNHSSAAYWTAGIIGALLFFGSLLAHEMGHALVARHEGVGVAGITLWLLGGFARLESEPETPGAQFRIAAAGPVTNAALAGAFWVAHQAFGGGAGSGLAGAIEGPSLAAVVCAWLAFINGLLAAFNLLPAAPLDGGHVLSAGLWAATGNQLKARSWAAKAGLALGGLLIGAGFLQMRGSTPDNGIWLLVVGWWILSGARRDLAGSVVEGAFTDVRLSQVMQPNPPIVPAWVTVDDFVRTLPPNGRHQAFPVQAADGRIVGLLTVAQLAHIDPWHRANAPVSQLAFPIERVTWATASDPALPAVRRLAGSGLDVLLVVWPDGRVAGTVSGADLDAALQHARATHTPVGAGR